MDRKLKWFYFNKGMGQPGGGASSSLLTDLQVYYPLTEASGTRADSVGSVDLTDSGSVGSGDGPGGDLGTAAQFDGTNELISSSAAALQVGDADFTIAFWVYVTDGGANNWVCGKHNGAGGNEYLFRLQNGPLVFYLHENTTATTVATDESISSATWTPLRAGFDSANNQIFAQYDGGTRKTAAYTNVPTTGIGDFWLGGAPAVANAPNGTRIAGFAKWSRLLTDDEWDTFRAAPPVGYPF